MRVLTVRQPWAWAIIHGQKDVENRTRNIAGSYRGPIAIHAGLAFSEDGLRDPLVNEATVRTGGVPRYVTGAIIGVVDLVDVHASTDPWGIPCGGLDDTYHGHLCSPWAMENYRHLVLADPRPFAEPIPAKGRLGLWKPDANLLAEIENGGA